MVNFKPLHVAKRHSKGDGAWYNYSTAARKLSNVPFAVNRADYVAVDEKDEDWASASSAASSRASSGSGAPMLKENAKDPQRTSYTMRKSKRKFHRYFTIVLASMLLGFMGLLYVLSAQSARRVAAGAEKMAVVETPRVWESFPRLQRYFGGVRMLVSKDDNEPEYPIPHGELVRGVSVKYRKPWHGKQANQDGLDEPEHVKVDVRLNASKNAAACSYDVQDQTTFAQLSGFEGVIGGFPNHIIGSYDLLGLDDRYCFDRKGRYGAYDTKNSPNTTWAEAQSQCQTANTYRFLPDPDHPPKRVAVLVLTEADHSYTHEDILHLRSLIAETSLATSSSMTVHFLVHVDASHPDEGKIWADASVHAALLDASLPAEFRGMPTSLWSDRQVSFLYGQTASSARRNSQTNMDGTTPQTNQYDRNNAMLAIQHFAVQHPEYAHVWTARLGVRFVGHTGAFLEASAAWAKKQSRPQSLTLGQRWYVPSEHVAGWNGFVKLAMETNESPSTSEERDDTGAGEEADVLTFSPFYRIADTTGQNPQTDQHVATQSPLLRLSTRLLVAMHDATLDGTYLSPSSDALTIAFPLTVKPRNANTNATVKVVHVPHPTYIERAWPPTYLDAVLNSAWRRSGSGSRSISGQRMPASPRGPANVFARATRHNLLGLTFSTSAIGKDGFGTRLWAQWMRSGAAEKGGDEADGEGVMCLPPMLLFVG